MNDAATLRPSFFPWDQLGEDFTIRIASLSIKGWPPLTSLTYPAEPSFLTMNWMKIFKSVQRTVSGK